MIEHNTRLILAPCPFARCFRRFVLSSYTFIVQRVAAVMLVIRRSVEEPFVSDCQGLEISSLEADKIYSESKKCSSTAQVSQKSAMISYISNAEITRPWHKETFETRGN